MSEQSLLRQLTIGFMDSFTLEERLKLILSEISVSEILKNHPMESSHSEEVYQTMRWLDKSPANKIWWYTDKNYPTFGTIERRLPYMMLVHGNIPSPNDLTVSIVGTRNTDNLGFQMAYKLGLEASYNKISVISGLAYGCDQAALSGAVDGKTSCYAVIGCGLEIDYPKYSKKLKHRIIESGGGIISRFSPNAQPFKSNFPNRNTIIAAIGNFTIIVQAPRRSGALITVDYTLQMGKDVFVSK